MACGIKTRLSKLNKHPKFITAFVLWQVNVSLTIATVFSLLFPVLRSAVPIVSPSNLTYLTRYQTFALAKKLNVLNFTVSAYRRVNSVL